MIFNVFIKKMLDNRYMRMVWPHIRLNPLHFRVFIRKVLDGIYNRVIWHIRFDSLDFRVHARVFYQLTNGVQNTMNEKSFVSSWTIYFWFICCLLMDIFKETHLLLHLDYIYHFTFLITESLHIKDNQKGISQLDRQETN